DQRVRPVPLGQAQPGPQLRAVLRGGGHLGERARLGEGVGRVRQLLDGAAAAVDPHRVRGDGDAGGGGDDLAAGEGEVGEGEVLAGAAGEAARCGVGDVADPDGAAAGVVGGGDQGVLVQPDGVDPVVELRPDGGGLSGG